MKCILLTELATDFLVQGLGLQTEKEVYTGKLGRHEVELISPDSLKDIDKESLVLYLGKAEAGPFRAGDVLMAGSDDLLDRAFHALDEMEQRGGVVALAAEPEPDSHQVSLNKEQLNGLVQEWKEKEIPYLCLFRTEPVDSEGQATLVTLVRKVLN
jgi:hypothetical protein